MSLADGSASGRQPLERNLLEPVAGREIPERGMARHDLAACAVGEAAAVLAVERVEPAGQARRRRLPPERRADQPHHLGVAHRIEPHVGIARRAPAEAALLPQLGEHVERAALALLHRRLEAGHEAVAEVEDERGVVDGPHVGRCQLEVVRLGPGRRQVTDVGAAAGDLLRREGERVEGRHDLAPVAARRAARRSRSRARRRRARTAAPLKRTILESMALSLARK